MKKNLLLLLFMVNAGMSASDYAYKPYPSEYAILQTEEMTTSLKPKLKSRRGDGLPDGAVGATPAKLGEFSLIQLLVFVGIYFGFRKWNKRKK